MNVILLITVLFIVCEYIYWLIILIINNIYKILLGFLIIYLEILFIKINSFILINQNQFFYFIINLFN